MLMVIYLCAAAEGDQTEQQIGQRILRECAREIQRAACLHIAEAVLLIGAKLEAEFQQVRTACVGRGVQRLKRIRDRVLRVVEFITKRRKAEYGNKRQAKVARIRGDIRQAQRAIDGAALRLMIDGSRNAIESHPRFVDERR